MQENNAGGSNSLSRLWMEAGNIGCRWVEARREEQAVLWCHSIQRSSQAVSGRVTELLISLLISGGQLWQAIIFALL